MNKGFLLKGFYAVLFSGLGVQCVKRKVENTNTKSESSSESNSPVKSLADWDSQASLGKTWVWQRKTIAHIIDRRCPDQFDKVGPGNEFKLYQVDPLTGKAQKHVLWGVFCIDPNLKKGFLYTGEVDNRKSEAQVKLTLITSVEMDPSARRRRIPEKFKINEDKLNCNDSQAKMLSEGVKQTEATIWGLTVRYLKLEKKDFFTLYNVQQCDLKGDTSGVLEFGTYISFPFPVLSGLFSEIGVVSRNKSEFPKYAAKLNEEEKKSLVLAEQAVDAQTSSSEDVAKDEASHEADSALAMEKPDADPNLLTGFYSRPWRAQWVVHDHRKDIKETHLALIVLNPMILELSRRIHSGEPSSTGTEAPKPQEGNSPPSK